MLDGGGRQPEGAYRGWRRHVVGHCAVQQGAVWQRPGTCDRPGAAPARRAAAAQVSAKQFCLAQFCITQFGIARFRWQHLVGQRLVPVAGAWLRDCLLRYTFTGAALSSLDLLYMLYCSASVPLAVSWKTMPSEYRPV